MDIVIGTGQAGPSMAVRLAQSGRETVIIERARFGGTCVNDGCIPTKALVASARAAWVARHAEDFGVRIEGPVATDMKKVKARKDAIVGQSREGLAKWLEGTRGLRVVRGDARFVGPKTVRVGDETLQGERIFINVGGRPSAPPIEGLAGSPYLTNTSMMEIDFLPEHLVVLGGSYIGLEFAQMYRRFGSRVTVIEVMPRIIAREDEEVSAEVQKILEREGVTFHVGASVTRVEGSTCVLASGARVEGSHLLVATGRVPNTDTLGLDAAGIEVDKRGFVVVDDQLRTNGDRVWALGDCNGKGAFTHTSYNDYEIVAANLFDGDPRRVSDRILTYALFTDPPLGRAGMSEKEARESGKRVLVGKMPMSRVGRARERGETQGFMKILIDADDQRILGASLLGIEADEVIHMILDVMYARAPYTLIQRAVHIHPTVSELVPTMLGDLRPL